ncbi:MAG: phosphatidate cytidylyltransferase, partial [Bacteroidia bacterium]|nr:phosphatidate cytidylyltransferase [Bacteroidia bacterium]
MEISNLQKRVLTAVIAGSIVVSAIASVWWGLLMFCLLVSILGLTEYLKLSNLLKAKPETLIVYIASFFGWFLVLNYVPFQIAPQKLPIFFLLLVPLTGISFLYNAKQLEAFAAIGKICFGIVYAVLPFWLFYLCGFQFTNQEYNFRLPLGLLILLWATDTFAYFAGKMFGKTKFFPRISPGKTWEGFIGALFGTFGIAMLLNYI